MKIFNLYVPFANGYPVVASFPHSGTYIPRKICKQFGMAPGQILSPVDWYLERLYDFLPELGVTMLQATHSRYVVNLNRSLDTPLFGPEPISVIPDKTCFGKPLYDTEPDENEIGERINRYYLPYHRQLKRILDRMIKDFGRAYLIDLHSYYAGPPVDICLGNVNETTCSEGLIGSFEKALCNYYFNVVRNEKWTGGHITKHYGSMNEVETLQIELWFPSYLEGQDFDEAEVPRWDSEKFWNTKQRMCKVFSDVIHDLL